MKLLIIHPEGNIKNNPNLYYFCKELVNLGFQIKLFSRENPNIYQGTLFNGAEIEYYSMNKIANFKIKKKLISDNFDFVIGIDDGIIEAELISKAIGVPYAFLSYEIFFDKELISLNNKTDIRQKQKTVRACQNIQFAIVQDETRKQCLINEYHISEDKILLMPVAGKGVKALQRTSYFHDKLKIEQGKKILLYMGWMDDFQLDRLTKYAKFLPEDWVLVIHSRYKYVGKVLAKDSKSKIYFSLDEPIENIEDIGILLSDVNAGFCSYQPDYKTPFTGENVKYIGLSSGKASTFLQYGIPVVVENMNIWDELVTKYKIGIVLKKPQDLLKLEVLNFNEITPQSCFEFFDKYLDINNFIPSIVNQINISSEKKESRNFLPFYLQEFVSISKYILKKILK
ncbi:MAG TPA: hypothetical protein PKX15_05335 [Bacteroidales bacterium]|nr:hypothetical protein [Bacteroidales bacterium]